MYPLTTLPAFSGNMFASRNAWMCSPSPEKIGNAAMRASVRVTSGTSASKVVKVRLEAICKQRSSLNRLNTCARKRPSCRSGKGMGSMNRGVNVVYDTSAISDPRRSGVEVAERIGGNPRYEAEAEIVTHKRTERPSPLRVDALRAL